MLIMDLHHAGIILNPYLLDDFSIHEDAIVKSWFLDAMRILTTHIDDQYGRVVAKFWAFKESKSAFANMPLAMKANIPPHEWWDFVGEGGIHLIPLAKSIWPMCILLHHAKRIGVVIHLCRTKLRISWVWLRLIIWFIFIPMQGWHGRGWIGTWSHGI